MLTRLHWWTTLCGIYKTSKKIKWKEANGSKNETQCTNTPRSKDLIPHTGRRRCSSLVRWHKHNEVHQVHNPFRDVRQGLETRLNFGGWWLGNYSDIDGNLLSYKCDGCKRRWERERKSLPKLRKYINKVMPDTSGPFMQKWRYNHLLKYFPYFRNNFFKYTCPNDKMY